MARVDSTGGVVTLTNLAAMPGGDKGADPNIVNLNIRLFALLDTGLTVFDLQPQSMGFACNRDQLGTREDLEGWILRGLRSGQLTPGHRKAYWQQLIEEMGKWGIHTDPETLQSLPCDLLVAKAVRDLLGNQG